MNTDLTAIEIQEADELREKQLIRRLEAARKTAEALAAAAAAAPKLLPPAEVVDVISNAILGGGNARVEFEGLDGQSRLADVRDKGPRASKEQTLEMRNFLNLLGVRALDVIMSDGLNGLRAFWKPGKSACVDDKGFYKMFRSLMSLESRTGRMTMSAYGVLLPTLKLMRRRAKP